MNCVMLSDPLRYQESPSAVGLKAKATRPAPSGSKPRPSARPPPSTPALPLERERMKVEELDVEESKKDTLLFALSLHSSAVPPCLS